MSRARPADRSTGHCEKPTHSRAQAHLEAALEMLDALDAPPEIGARLQQVIDSLEDYRSTANK